jgi:hypothetical protein
VSDLSKMSVRELVMHAQQVHWNNAIAELERRTKVPDTASNTLGPWHPDIMGGANICWVYGWNACLDKIKEIRNG